MHSSSQIKKFILDNLTRHQKDIVYAAVQRFGVSRQAVLKHMHTLISEKKVIAHGKTRDRFYELRPQINYNKTIPIDNEFSTQLVISKNILPNIVSLPKNLFEIVQFSITALLNNISDHSKATKLYFKLYLTYDDFHMIINATSLGLNNETINLDFPSLGNDKLFYDVIYNPHETRFLKIGKELGYITENGKTMFVYQALEAFKLWHKIEPKVNADTFKLLDHD